MDIKKNTALVIIDMINDFDFEYGEILAKKAYSISSPLKKLKDIFYHKHLPVIFINDHYNLWQANLTKIIQYCTNERSQPILEQIQPTDQDYFLIKPKHSAFYGTALNTLLHQLKIETLVLTGIAGNICVLFTANDAYMREYELMIPSNCIASVNDQDHEYTLRMMENVLKAKINPFSS